MAMGRFSYGDPTIHSWSKDDGNLSVGSFCSFASNVNIYLGGEHRTDWISTYPFFINGTYAQGHPATKGDVTIEHDVWVGNNATILSGVKIESGAVIGAHSVVTKDVPAYSIVAGNPARLIRYRFPEEQVAKLLSIRWWDWPEDIIIKNAETLCSNNFEKLLQLSEAINSTK